MASPDNMVSCASIDLNSIHCVGIQQGLATRVKDNKKAFEKLNAENVGKVHIGRVLNKKKVYGPVFYFLPILCTLNIQYIKINRDTVQRGPYTTTRIFKYRDFKMIKYVQYLKNDSS